MPQGFCLPAALHMVGTKWITISFNLPCQNPTDPCRVCSAIFCLTKAFLNCSWSLLSLPPEVAFCITEEFCSTCKGSSYHNYEYVVTCIDSLSLLLDDKFLVQKHFFSHCILKASNIFLCTEDDKSWLIYQMIRTKHSH